MNQLCDKNEAQAFHPPEQKKTADDGAVLWAVVVVIALASSTLWIAAGSIEWQF